MRRVDEIGGSSRHWRFNGLLRIIAHRKAACETSPTDAGGDGDDISQRVMPLAVLLKMLESS